MLCAYFLCFVKIECYIHNFAHPVKLHNNTKMLNQTIITSIISLAPYWSNTITSSFSLGNEYSMAITAIISELVKFLSPFLSDTISIILLTCIACVMIASRFGFDISMFKLKSITKVTVFAREIIVNDKICIIGSPAFRAVNHLLITKYQMNNLTYFNDSEFDVIVDNVKNHKIEDDLYVTVEKLLEKDNFVKINIILSSYKKNVNLIVKTAIDQFEYCDKKYKLTLVGVENKNVSFNYPESMIYMTHVLIHYYKMNKLKILNTANKFSDTDSWVSHRENDKKESRDATKSASEKQFEEIEDFQSKFKTMFLLDNCNNFKLSDDMYDDMYITIERSSNIVTYTLSSNTHDIKEFMKYCLHLYKQSVCTCDEKFMVKISGVEVLSNNVSTIEYPQSLIAFFHRVISLNTKTNYRIVDTGKKQIKIIDKLNNFVIDNIVVNTKTSTKGSWEVRSIMTTFMFESTIVNISNYLEECTKEYEKYLNNLHNDVLYYFKYLGKIDGKYKFSKSILSSKDFPLYETFDHVHNEHVEQLKSSIDMLKDLEYYKKTGLRRKLSFLFHGPPGCGKNATTLAMALYDNRHIIDISLNIVQYNSEFYDLMNLTSIEDVTFTRDKIIIMFDEMHIGINKICNKELLQQNLKVDENEKQDSFIKKMTFNESPNKKCNDNVFDTLDLGCILSTTDGIGNYGGLIIVGLTNYIEQIPLPLRRSLRFTPMLFTYLRAIDVISVVENFFKIKINDCQQIPDRKISPSSLVQICGSCLNFKLDIFLHDIQNIDETNST